MMARGNLLNDRAQLPKGAPHLSFDDLHRAAVQLAICS
jgi:hypothetical protein